jgi:membrane peptidoglycan carboxypeptidase
MGITTLGSAARYGLTLVLGGGEVTLLEETGAYAVFANDGVRNPPTGILQVTDSSGNVLESYEPQPQQVLDPQIARQMNDILSDNAARTPEFGANSPLQFDGYNVADKTGTTNDFRDVWVLGYTPSIAVGAWAGNNNNSAMAKKIAAFIIAPMWHEFMLAALQKYSSPSDDFPAPAPETATLPPVLTGNWNTDPTQGIHDILYWVNKSNPRVAHPGGSGDGQMPYWDYPVSLWAGQNPQLNPGGLQLPTATGTPSGLPSGQPGSLRITSPQSGATTPLNATMTLAAASEGTSPVSSVSFYINGALVGTTGAPYSISYNPTARGTAILRAVATHPDGTTEEQTLVFTVQ